MKHFLYKIIGFSFLSIAMLHVIPTVYADTPLEAIKLDLKIEVQDLEYDFADDGETVQHERIVIYSLEVKNTSGTTQNDLRLFMGDPDYMEFQEGEASLSTGYSIESLGAGESLTFESKYKVVAPNSIEEETYTVAWAALVGQYSAIPVMSNPVNTIIFGEPVGNLSVEIASFPEEGEVVLTGQDITYTYKLTNSGGEPLEIAELTTSEPRGTKCMPNEAGFERCGRTLLSEIIEPGEYFTIQMKVEVTTNDSEQEFIINDNGYVIVEGEESQEIKDKPQHPLNVDINVVNGELILLTEHVPNLILNSPDGNPRTDKADISEVQYAIIYGGLRKSNTYTSTGNYGVQEAGVKYFDDTCGRKTYNHGFDSTVYAYNSSGGGCDKMTASCIQSSSINFDITTTLPSDRPSLVLLSGGTTQVKTYSYGSTQEVNDYMKSGGKIKVPANFLLSRAIKDGVAGETVSSVKAEGITEDLWSYDKVNSYTVTCPCGEDSTCSSTYPIYAWVKSSSQVVPVLTDGDSTYITVYTSTAAIKTQGGHVGTNGSIINNETDANQVGLDFGGGYGMEENEYIYDDILTPTKDYSPTGYENVDYMVFANEGAGAFVSAAGPNWIVTGTDFGPQQQGDAYDRENNPRSYKDDLLEYEKFGEVRTDELPSTLSGSRDIEDGIVWHQTGDLTIGVEGVNDEVIFTGGQSRIYVDGDVYINADIYYGINGGTSYNDSTSLRIDANNIIVSGEVTDLEVLLQARDNFHSGESNDQLRILGDVITGQAHWERKPLLELDPEDDEINKPSEYIIEDLRKYVIPVPGDTELPDEYDIWRQVNPSTGQVLDAY